MFAAQDAQSAAQANRNFSALLRKVAQGTEVTVLSRGKAVARVLPADENSAERALAKSNLMKRLKKQKPSGVARDWTRAELYD